MSDWPKISGIISDLDGVAYRGDDPIESAVAAFRTWEDAGLPYAFVTNNSTKSAEEFADKLNAMGIPATAERIVTTSAAAAARLSQLLPTGARVMVIGASALHQAVVNCGFELKDKDVSAVVVGLDRTFTFDKLARAQTALLGGAIFIGTNADQMLPNGSGFEPGAGSILKAIETASRVPPIIIGKPQPDLVAKALKILGTPPTTTFMLGDQVGTDIVAGHLAGLQTILVKTGVQETGPFPINPDFEVDTLAKIPVTLSASKRGLVK